MNNKEIKILFLGDLVGRVARRSAAKFLSKNKDKYDFIIANVENASHGFGLTSKNYNELSDCGIDLDISYVVSFLTSELDVALKYIEDAESEFKD